MTGYQSKRAAAQAIDKVNWADHEPNGRSRPDRNSYLHTTTGEHMKDEALKLALRDLENAEIATNSTYESTALIREALAQLEQEPLEYWNAVEGWVKVDEVREHFASVGCGTIYKTAGEDRVPVYTTPPQRTWVDLTENEIEVIEVMALTKAWAIRMTMAQLREKNA